MTSRSGEAGSRISPVRRPPVDRLLDHALAFVCDDCADLHELRRAFSLARKSSASTNWPLAACSRLLARTSASCLASSSDMSSSWSARTTSSSAPSDHPSGAAATRPSFDFEVNAHVPMIAAHFTLWRVKISGVLGVTSAPPRRTSPSRVCWPGGPRTTRRESGRPFGRRGPLPESRDPRVRASRSPPRPP